MNRSNVATSHRSRNHRPPSSTLTFDVKPLVKIALSSKKSKAFCAKTNTLAKLRNSRYKYIKTQLLEEIEAIGMDDFVDELTLTRTYLHPSVHRAIGKHLTFTADISPVMRRKVI